MERNLPDIQFDKLKGRGGKPLKYVLGAVVVLILINFLNPFVTVGAGERGVVLTSGAVPFIDAKSLDTD